MAYTHFYLKRFPRRAWAAFLGDPANQELLAYTTIKGPGPMEVRCPYTGRVEKLIGVTMVTKEVTSSLIKFLTRVNETFQDVILDQAGAGQYVLDQAKKDTLVFVNGMKYLFTAIDRHYYVPTRRRNLNREAASRPSGWTLTKGELGDQVYLSCYSCKSILKPASPEHVLCPDGRILPCITCEVCGFGSYYWARGYKGAQKALEPVRS
jgi:hypothetical protein